MRRAAFTDPRFWLLVLALLATLATLLAPGLPMGRDAYALIAFVDITGSMNTRDMKLGGETVSRIKAAQDSLSRLVAALPCGSTFGLGVFAERRTFLLFEPIETCNAFAAIEGAIDAIDWRMGWAGDSYVSRGLLDGLATAQSIDADILFLTDGHEAPPLPYTGPPAFEGEAGKTRGLIVGVGGRTKVPIPKFDSDGRETGTWRPEEVPQENRQGPPPADAVNRPGYNPRNAPWGGDPPISDEHLTEVKEDNLIRLARETGLNYVALGAGDLIRPVERAARPRPILIDVDIGWIPATIALGFLLIAAAILPGIERVRARFPDAPAHAQLIPSRTTVPQPASKQGAPLMRAAALFLLSLLPIVSSNAHAHGPTPQKAEEKIIIAAPPEKIWAEIKDFGGIAEWHPGVEKSEAKSETEREITLKSGGVLTEGRDDFNDQEMYVAWRLAKENIELFPVSFYSATLTVKPADKGSEVVWEGRFYRGDTSNFPPESQNDEAAQKAMSSFMIQGLQGLKAKLEKPEG